MSAVDDPCDRLHKLQARCPIPGAAQIAIDHADLDDEESDESAEPLVADKAEITRFVAALFRYADRHTYASLRAFDQFRRDVPPELIRPVLLHDDGTSLIRQAVEAASSCATQNRHIVFAPPICTFTNPDRARGIDLANGLALSVELDEDTHAARTKLEGLLGPATVVVASGGEWPDPDTGEMHAKLHLHWRLSEPTRSEAEHQQLRRARTIAVQLTGADPTGSPIVHPLRWPGSWNIKNTARPRMARIVAANVAAEIHLVEALEALSNAAELAGWASADLPHSSEPQAPLWMLQSAMRFNANPDLHYGDWVARGYACWHATRGTADGFNLFEVFSQKSGKYVAKNTETVWKAIAAACRDRNPPITAGAGTIFFFARLGGWKRPPIVDDPGYAESQAAEAKERAIRTPSPGTQQHDDPPPPGDPPPLPDDDPQPPDEEQPPPRPDGPPDETPIRARLAAAFLRNPKLKARWEGGTEGLRDTNRSARDFSVVRMLKADGFTKEEARAALRLFEHGKSKDEDERYFERMWERTTVKPAMAADLSTIWDPWEDKPPPTWPDGTLATETERALTLISQRDGIDGGLLGTSVLAAGSAAAPKNARFFPYQHEGWAVPPILWIITIGESGTRKTLLETVAFGPLRDAHAKVWRAYRATYADWERTPKKQRSEFPPPEPHSFIVNDTTAEALQDILAATARGTAMIKDELAGFFEFGRYSTNRGDAARAFYLSSYEDQGCAVHRVKRNSQYIEHTGLSIFDAIQPRRLAEFRPDMETDGMLQRFLFVRAAQAAMEQPNIHVGAGLATAHNRVGALCDFNGLCPYHTTPEGSDVIHNTRALGRELAAISDYGPGWPGFCSKLHGTHARLAFVIHLLEAHGQPLIPADTVKRADRLLRAFLLPHAIDFFDALPGSHRQQYHDIAGWLLTRRPADAAEPERILASDLTNGVKSCRRLGSKGIGDVLDPFVTGGWLFPETDYPNNRAWFFPPAIRTKFAERTITERDRRTRIRDLIARSDQRS
jgi:hypothetical protein